MKKAVIILSIIFILKLFISCSEPCGETGPQSFKVNYTDISIQAIDLSGFEIVEIEGKVYKNSFGLIVDIISEHIEEDIAFMPIPNIGFSRAMACSPITKFNITDPLLTLKIYLIDKATEETTDISEKFKVEIYSDKLISIDEYLKTKRPTNTRFNLKLIDSINIPDKAIFMAESYFESGKSFTRDTKIIEFVE